MHKYIHTHTYMHTSYIIINHTLQLRDRTAAACKKQWVSLAWTVEDNLTLFLAQRFFGNAWKEIVKLFPGWEKSFLTKKLANIELCIM